MNPDSGAFLGLQEFQGLPADDMATSAHLLVRLTSPDLCPE